MENVTDRISNPFDMQPPCERFVPGYGDANAHFHVVGDHPGVHGDGTAPFTNEAGLRLQRALEAGGVIEAAGTEPDVGKTFLSYLHMCVPEGTPTRREYADMERYFDAEVRAIAAHVIIPVGDEPIRHVLEHFTARAVPDEPASLHATELRGGGWLVLPVKEPAEWTDEDEATLVAALRELISTDYRRESDLGRFLAGDEPYYVR